MKRTPMLDRTLRLLVRVSGLYPLLAFLTARRMAVRGWSMHPALAPGERVLFDRLAYRLAPPRRGDLVLASHPARPGLRLVKRVAALPGDSVVIEGESCWVNGAPAGATSDPFPLSLPALSEAEGSKGAEGTASTEGIEACPERSRRVRARGPGVRVLGSDEYLLLGDAPDFSTDSRQLGPVSRERIKARAWWVYWPPGRVRRLG